MEDFSDTISSSESEYISSKESLRDSSESSEDELNQVDDFCPIKMNLWQALMLKVTNHLANHLKMLLV